MQAISRNLAFAIASPVIDGYFGTYPTVGLPPIADVPVESILIDYSFEIFPEWDESRTEYLILITDGNTTPFASGFISTPDERTSFTSYPSQESVQGIREGLTDLIPVDRPLEIERCESNTGAHLMFWKVIIYWADGTSLELTNNGSSLLVGGGPWFVEIDDQTYMQYSSAFLDSLSVLAGELGLSEISFDNTTRRLESCERWFYYHPDYFEEAFPGKVKED